MCVTDFVNVCHVCACIRVRVTCLSMRTCVRVLCVFVCVRVCMCTNTQALVM